MPFSAFGLHADLVRAVKDLGFLQPTPIQKEAIPAGMARRDVLACSATGSGKTAAFLLPVLHRLLGRPRGTTRALIVAPTRELAAQIGEHLSALATFTPLTSATVYGGVGMGPQRQALERGVDILIATPGRLLDHLRHPYARLNGVEVLVLDEADRMLDMGFLPDIRRIMQRLPRPRQTFFFSATLPAPIVALTRDLLTDPVTINLARQARPVTGVTQSIYPVPSALKSPLLLKLVQGQGIRNALVFTRTKRRADRVADYLERHGVSAARIHGDRSQSQRTQAMDGFKRGRYRILVATDVAARGIDVDALSHVINFDLPRCSDDYVHRVGRTARAQATGDAFTFVAPEEEGDLRAIERALACKLPRALVPEFDYAAVPPARTGSHSAHELPVGRPARNGRHNRPRHSLGRGPDGAGAARPWGSRPARTRHSSGRETVYV
jgi:ATP-dependent RNA helicase RhlE